MTVDATKPEDAEVLSTHAGYIRLLAAAINAATIVAGTDTTTVVMTAGQTIISTFSTKQLDVVYLTAGAAEDLNSISGDDVNVKGNLKIIIFGDANIAVKHGTGNIYLNGDDDLDAESGDVLAIQCDGNDWFEVFRKLDV